MIPVRRIPEPTNFDEDVRQPGQKWLAANPGAKRPRDFWSKFRAELADGFSNLCGYTAMHEPVGTVDHFKSYKSNPGQAYEWSNYRFAAQWINSSKQTKEVLDPHDVGDEWFEIHLPSLQLMLVPEKIPPNYLELAKRTLTDLPIAHDERVLKQRRCWYKMYLEKKLHLDGLREVAPLIAIAVEKQIAQAVKGNDTRPAGGSLLSG